MKWMYSDDIAKPEGLVNHAQKSRHWQHLCTTDESRLVLQGSAASCTHENVTEIKQEIKQKWLPDTPTLGQKGLLAPFISGTLK